MDQKLYSVLGESSDVKKDQICDCLKILDAEEIFDEIKQKGSGSSLFYQLENDGSV